MTGRNLFAIVLAAGLGERFGSSKQLQEYRGTPLVARALRLAESVCDRRSVLVTGHEWRAVVDACFPVQGFFVRNERYRSGLGASIACGVRSVYDAADAVLLLLADQPLVSQGHLEQLISTWNGSAADIAATGFAGTAGPPVIFPRRYFDELIDLRGDSGARAVLQRAAGRLSTVHCEDAAVDIDRPADLQRLR